MNQLRSRQIIIPQVALVLFALLLSFRIGWSFANGQGSTFLLTAGLLVVTGLLLRWPSWPLIVGYPIIWIFWSYYLPFGRPEKVIAVLGMLGATLLISRRRFPLPVFPDIINLGLFFLLGSYLVSWLMHFRVPGAQEWTVSLVMRVMFLYLAYFHLQTENQLRWASGLYIASSVLAAIETLAVSLKYGFGFFRVYSQYSLFQKDLEAFWRTPVFSTIYSTAPALLVLGLYASTRDNYQKVRNMALALFLFWMAFAAEYRREILFSVPVVLLFLAFDRAARVRKPAILLLLASLGLFSMVLLPYSTVLQDRLQREMADIFAGTEIRIVSLRTGVTAFLDSPFLGYGAGSYRMVAERLIGSGYHPAHYNPYNVFVWIAVEAGVFGLIGIFLLLFGTYLEARKFRNQASGTAGWILRCAPVLILQIMIWFSFINAWDLSMPWFLMGMILAAARMTKTSSKVAA